MRAPVVMLAALAAVIAVADAPKAVRNPFWPIGHQGVSTPISAEVRAKPAPPEKKEPTEEERAKEEAAKKAAAEAAAKAKAAKEKAEAEERARVAKAAAEAKAAKEKAEREAALRAVITEADWAKAGKSLKTRMPAVLTDPDGSKRYAVSINGNVYSDGDWMSISHDGIRFTWRVEGLSGTNTLLKLVRVRAQRIPDANKGGNK